LEQGYFLKIDTTNVELAMRIEGSWNGQINFHFRNCPTQDLPYSFSDFSSFSEMYITVMKRKNNAERTISLFSVSVLCERKKIATVYSVMQYTKITKPLV
jgi:hypothetical protein